MKKKEEAMKATPTSVMYALDAMPVLHRFVEQHLYSVPKHMPNGHVNVLVVQEVLDDKHEYSVLVIDPVYVEAVFK